MIQMSKEDFKKDYAFYVSKATELLHSPKTTGSIQAMLDNNNPVQKIASATVIIMNRLDTASREANTEIQDTVKVFGAHEIVNLVIELGEAAGRFPKLDERLSELALSVAVQDYVKGEVKAGRIDPKRLEVAMQADVRKLPPAKRKEVQHAQIRIQQTARLYNNGKGVQNFVKQ